MGIEAPDNPLQVLSGPLFGIIFRVFHGWGLLPKGVIASVHRPGKKVVSPLHGQSVKGAFKIPGRQKVEYQVTVQRQGYRPETSQLSVDSLAEAS